MIKPYYETPLGKLYHGDCLEIMPHLEPVDLVLTDPPYGIGYSKYKSHKDKKAGYIEFLWPRIELSESKVSNGFIAVFQATKNLRKCGKWFPREWRPIAIGREFAQWMPTYIQFRTDYVLFWKIGKPPKWKPQNMPRDYYTSSICCVTQGPNKRVNHPCPRPLDTILYLVDILSWPNSLCLDIFFGSGTLAVACERLNRRWIGIEIEEKYCEIAAKRIEKERSQLKLW